MALQANFLVEEIMLENPGRRIKRGTQQKRWWVVRLQAWYTEPRAARATRGSRLFAAPHFHVMLTVTCFAIFNSFFPTDFRGKKKRLLAAYWGHWGWQYLAALVESSSLRRTIMSMKLSKTTDLVFSATFLKSPLSCLVLLPGSDSGHKFSTTGTMHPVSK